MKVTVVPAQVTTVEDRIIGSLTFAQMLLLFVPIFLSAAMFAVLPPFMGGRPYKYILMGVLALVCCILAIRVRGRILALWAATILKYNLRPKHYVFNKNTEAMREQYELHYEMTDTELSTDLRKQPSVLPLLSFTDTARLLSTIENPASNFRFEATKKGGLHVRLAEIED